MVRQSMPCFLQPFCSISFIPGPFRFLSFPGGPETFPSLRGLLKEPCPAILQGERPSRTENISIPFQPNVEPYVAQPLLPPRFQVAVEGAAVS